MVSYSLPEPRLLFHTQTHYCGNNYFIFYLWSLTGSVCHCGIHTPPHCWLSRLEVGCCEQHSWVCALRSAQTQHPGWGAVQHRRKEQGVSSSLAFLELVFKSLSGCSSLSEGLGEPDKGTQSKQVFSFLWLRTELHHRRYLWTPDTVCVQVIQWDAVELLWRVGLFVLSVMFQEWWRCAPWFKSFYSLAPGCVVLFLFKFPCSPRIYNRAFLNNRDSRVMQVDFI